MNSKIFEHRDQIFEVAKRYKAHGIQVFGSQARNEEDEKSDLDLLVTFDYPNLLDRIGLKQDIEELLGMSVDIVTESNLSSSVLEEIRRDAISL